MSARTIPTSTKMTPFIALACVILLALAPKTIAALVNFPLTADTVNSDPSAHGGNIVNTLADTFAYDPASPTAPTPATAWSGATHFHGAGGNPTVYFTLSAAMTWVAGSDLQFDFYGRTGCCPDRDNNYDIALLTGGATGTVVNEVLGNNAPDAGTPLANYLRTDMGAGLTDGDTFDTVRIVGNNINFTIAEVQEDVAIDDLDPEIIVTPGVFVDTYYVTGWYEIGKARNA